MNKKTFELGTAVKITTILTVNSPTTCKISIRDSANITKTDEVSMTEDATNIYSYIYQSSVSGVEGEYKIIIDATYGSYTSRAISHFTLIDSVP